MKNKIKGVVFDFNGTMFVDQEFQERAWREYLEGGIGRSISDEELQANMHGRNAIVTFTYFFGRPFTKEEVFTLVEGKEIIYRKLCLESGRAHLTAGLPLFLDILKDEGIPMTIATASPGTNVDFYFRTFDLGRWFDRRRVVYDDGSFRGKPEPDIYLKAFDVLGLDGEQCVVFEDASSGVKAASRAGAGVVVGVESMLDGPTLLGNGATMTIRGFEDPEGLFRKLFRNL